jgi:hypothetical protein
MDESQVARATAVPFGRRLAVCIAIGVYAAVAALARPLTIPSTFTVLLSGVAIVVHGVRRRPTTVVRTTGVTVATWIGLGLVFCGWELVAYYWGNDAAHPTLSLLADPVLDTYAGRLAGYLLWLGTGAWLVNR